MATKQFTVTKQMVADIYSGAANPGDDHLPIGRFNASSANPSYTGRAALYAPVSLSDVTSLTSATLHLFYHNLGDFHAKGAETATLHVFRKTLDWSESSHGGSTALDEVFGGDGSVVVNNGYAARVATDFKNVNELADGVEVTIPITGIVQAWLDGSPNYGLLLLNATSETDPDKGKEFYSRHASGLEPYIEITYEGNSAPNAPTDPYPTADDVVKSSTLSMKHSDPDVNDLAYKAQFRLFEFGGSKLTADSDRDFVHANGIDCSWSAYPLVSGRRYEWDGRTNDGEVWGARIAKQSFYYEPTQPAPSITSPKASNEVTTLTPNLRGAHNLLGDSTMSDVEVQVDIQNPDSSWSWQWKPGPQAASGDDFTIQVGVGVLDWGETYRWKARVKTDLGTWSNWSGWHQFVTQSPDQPQDVTPANEKITSTTPTLGFSVEAGAGIQSWDVEVYDETLALYDSRTGQTTGITGDTMSDAWGMTALAVGGDYTIRFRYTNGSSVQSAWTAHQSISVNAAPSAPTLIEPQHTEVITTLTPLLDWTFNDEDTEDWGDSQTAYELEVRLNSDDSLIDTLTGTTATSRTYDGAALSYDTYKWRVRTTDDDGVQGAWSGYSLFTTAQPPTVSGVQFAAADLDAQGEINGPTPTAEWTFTPGVADPQATYRVELTRVSDEDTVHDSGVISGTATSYQIPNSIILDGETYRLDVTVTDTNGLEDTAASADYTADFAPPAALAGVQTTADPDASKITIGWEASADGAFDHYEVWRRKFGEAEWTVLAESLPVGVTSYEDYGPALNQTYEYAVLQVHLINGRLYNGEYQPVSTAISGVPQWYLVAESRDDLTVKLEWATAAADAIPVQQQVVEALGRKYKIVVEGEVLGSDGRITVRVDGTEYEQVNAIERLLRARLDRVLVKSPTGEVYPSKIGSIVRTRQSHGAVEVTFPYTQIEES